MTFPIRNNQTFIESIILYEVNNWKPIDEICENLSRLVDNELIPKSCSIPELSVESLTKFVRDMNIKNIDSIQKDQKFIGSVIFYEVLIGEMDKEKLYKKLLRRIGSDLIYCPDFSHWYHEFKNENFDIDDDSLASESPTFSELPVDVIGVVVEKLELKEQLSLRKVSRNLRIVVDQNKPAYKTIKINIKPNHIHIKFNDENVMYCGTGFDVDSHRYWSKLDEKQIIENSDYVEIAFNDVAIALKNPKLQLESLEFEYRSNSYLPEFTSGYQNATQVYEKMGNLLKRLNHKISVRNFSMRVQDQSQLVISLPYLMPKALKTIYLCDDCAWRNHEYNIDEIVQLDQWKYAKDVTINAVISSSIEYFIHFNRFVVQLHFILTADLIRIRDELLTSPDFQYCSMSSHNMPSFAEIERIFDLKVLPNAFWYSWIIRFCQIPNSKDFLKFEITSWSVSIERMSHSNTNKFDFVNE